MWVLGRRGRVLTCHTIEYAIHMRHVEPGLSVQNPRPYWQRISLYQDRIGSLLNIQDHVGPCRQLPWLYVQLSLIKYMELAPLTTKLAATQGKLTRRFQIPVCTHFERSDHRPAFFKSWGRNQLCLQQHLYISAQKGTPLLSLAAAEGMVTCEL